MFAGRLDPDKGPEVLLDVVARLEHPTAVTMAGAGRLEPELRAQPARLGLEARVTMPGWLDDPAPLIARAAVLVIPSRDQSFSQTVVLGMGLGVPVIGTRVDGFPATLAQGRGIVVAPDDPAALTAAIDGVLAGRLTVDLEGARRETERRDSPQQPVHEGVARGPAAQLRAVALLHDEPCEPAQSRQAVDDLHLGVRGVAAQLRT